MMITLPGTLPVQVLLLLYFFFSFEGRGGRGRRGGWGGGEKRIHAIVKLSPSL